MKTLVVTADDFGLSLQINEAVERAHRDGILSAASLMVAGPAVADAVARARALPTLAVGLHLVLVEGKPMSNAQMVPRLVGRDGRLRTDLARLGVQIAFDPTSRRQLREEIEMQFEAFASTGLRLDHVNGHKHYHVHPLISGMVIEMAQKYASSGLRVPVEPHRVLQRIEPTPRAPGTLALAPWAARMRKQAHLAGVATPDAVFGLAWSGAFTRTRLARLLANLPDGLSEIYMHPGLNDRFEGAAPGYRYADELAALVAPECRQILDTHAIHPGGYGARPPPQHDLAA